MRLFSFLLASTITAIVLMPEASAMPLFARQTGMACSSCHFQHFPLLNGFGRAFKAAGYTMISGQGKVEGNDLSIPNTLNMALLARTGYEKSNQAPGADPVKSTGDGVFYVPASGGELSLSFGGRLSDRAGFLGELSTGDAGGAHSSAKMPVLVDMPSVLPEGVRLSVVPFATDVQGASYGFETLNTGANAAHQMVGAPGFNGAHSGAFSAQQYIGTNGAAKGLALVVSNPVGFINLTRFDRTGITGGALANLSSTYLRVVGMFDWGAWDAAAGIQSWSGSSAVANPLGGAPIDIAETKATAADVQLQGQLGELPTGFYMSYATAPAVAATLPSLGNAYNTYYDNTGMQVNGHKTKSSFNVAGEVGVMPDKATLGAAIRLGKSGDGKTDNAIMLMGTYNMAQNMMASLAVTSASGSYWYSDAANKKGTTDIIGNTTYTINLFAAF